MKTRIFGSILIVVILLGLYVVTESSDSVPAAIQSQPATNNNDSAMKSLSIN